MPRDANQTISFSYKDKVTQSFQTVDSCEGLQDIYDASDWPKGNDLETVAEIDRRVRERFVYRREKQDTWTSQARLMLTTDYRWAGDCDDLAGTVVGLARCAGVPKERLGFSLLKTNGSDTINHMNGFYTDETGASYAIGDTFSRGVRPMLTYTQDPVAWAFLDAPTTWFTEKNTFGSVVKAEVFTNPERAFKTASDK